MRYLEYRVIPGYENYGVTKNGIVRSIPRNSILRQYKLNGYAIVDTFRGSLTETLPVHRAVALAWVVNLNPKINIVVNHLDGNKLNNWWENLEWTTHSGNNYHAVNTGLRTDNIPCQVRDFETGAVYPFNSISQACEHMGFLRDMPPECLLPKKFGSLINGLYEFKYQSDTTPWFYERRSEKVPPSRYMIEVEELNGIVQEVYSTKEMLKRFQLYDAPYGKSIPGLVKHANEKYFDKVFRWRDGYCENKHRVISVIKHLPAMEVCAISDVQIINFSSLTRAAKHFKVSRKNITGRLNNGRQLDGWVFTSGCLTSDS